MKSELLISRYRGTDAQSTTVVHFKLYWLNGEIQKSRLLTTLNGYNVMVEDENKTIMQSNFSCSIRDREFVNSFATFSTMSQKLDFAVDLEETNS